MAQLKLVVIVALFLVVINSRSSDALKCYSCMSCDDVSNESVQECVTKESAPIKADLPQQPQQSGIAGIAVLTDVKSTELENRADGWWCFSAMMKMTDMEHIVRDCTNNEKICDDAMYTDCTVCDDEDGCNAASSAIISVLTLAVTLVLSRFL